MTTKLDTTTPDFLSEEVYDDLITLVAEVLLPYAPTCREIDEGGLYVTIATNDEGISLGYQTGDNSFSGGAYGLPNWALVDLICSDTVADIVADVVGQWEDLRWEA
jgi:hypothetical protein